MTRSSSPRARRALLAALAIVLIATILFTTGRTTRDALDRPPAAPAGGTRADAELRAGAVDAAVQRAVRAAPPPPTRTGTSTGGVVRGTVVAGPSHDPVPNVAVLLMRDRRPFRTATTTDERGAFAFRGLVPDEYTPCVDPRSLPPGIMPPWDQIEGPSYGDVGFGPTRVRLEEGAEREVLLRCFVSARVVGRVVTRDGGGVAGAWLRAQSSAAGYRGLNADLGLARSQGLERLLFRPADASTIELEDDVTDSTGYFELVDVYPSTYELVLELTDRASLEHRALSHPPMRRFEVAEGAVVDVGDVRLGAGNRTVRGTVLDAWDDEPFADLEILCHDADGDWTAKIATARTDDDGRFELRRLPSVAVKLAVAPGGASRGIGRNVLAEFAPRVQLDLAAAPPVLELEPIRVWRSRPFRLHARLVAAPGITVDPSEWAVEVVCPPHAGRVSCAKSAEWNEERESFSWACEPPHEAVVVRLVRGSGRLPEEDAAVDSTTVEPQPDELREIELRVR